MFRSKFKVKSIKKFDLSNVERLPFFANGYVKKLGLYIVFSPDRDTLGYLSRESYEGSLTFKGCLTIKEKVLHSYSDKNISVIHNQRKLDILEEEITNGLAELASNNAPAFAFALAGDNLLRLKGCKSPGLPHEPWTASAVAQYWPERRS